MRGKEKQDNTVFGEVGITPACAGKRKIRALRASCTGDHPRVCGEKEVIPLRRCTIVLDHPRVCGEKSCSFSFLPKRAGSPPRVRGKVASSAASPISRRDHPRVCGEKISFCGMPAPILGSPPRVRGKGFCRSAIKKLERITPACAGKSPPTCCTGTPCGDHPRVCGEKSADTRLGRARPGSPPRVRGKGGRVDDSRQEIGITPACAGKSRVSESVC